MKNPLALLAASFLALAAQTGTALAHATVSPHAHPHGERMQNVLELLAGSGAKIALILAVLAGLGYAAGFFRRKE